MFINKRGFDSFKQKDSGFNIGDTVIATLFSFAGYDWKQLKKEIWPNKEAVMEALTYNVMNSEKIVNWMIIYTSVSPTVNAVMHELFIPTPVTCYQWMSFWIQKYEPEYFKTVNFKSGHRWEGYGDHVIPAIRKNLIEENNANKMAYAMMFQVN